MVENCLSDWGITRVLTITVDNASSNDGAISYLKKKTKCWQSTIFDNEFLHLRCCAHILNLIVKDGLKQQNESILKIRNAIRYVRSSPARLQAFKKCAEIEKIDTKSLVCLDIETRWNSTYLMLEAAVKFERAFERLKEDDSSYAMYFSSDDTDNNEDDEIEIIEKEGIDSNGKVKRKYSKFVGPPEEEDWDVAKSFIKSLKLFHDVTLQFSGSLHVTSNLFFLKLVTVQTRLRQLAKYNDTKVCLMAMKMQNKFAKYWDSLDNINLLLYVATVLDPRCKLRFVRFCIDQVYENDGVLTGFLEENLKNTLSRFYDYYKQHDPRYNTKHVSSSSNQASFDSMTIDEEVDTVKFLSSQFAKHLEENEFVDCKSELTKYLEENCEKDVEAFDLLQWWKVNSSKFSILTQIARAVLAIPVSTVASKSAFSTSGRILDPYRRSLNPEMVEALVCCQNWLRARPITIDFQESMKEVPMEEVQKYEQINKEFRIASTQAETVED